MAQALIVAGVTYLSIVVGELLPKRIGLNASDRVARLVAGPMRALSVVAMPVVWLLSKSTALLVKIFHIGHDSGKITEEEIKSVIREGTDAGEVRDLEQDIMLRALVMGDEKVSSIMTPKPDIVSLSLDMDATEIERTVRDEPHNCYPVYSKRHGGSIVGVVCLKDFVFEICDKDFSLSERMAPGTFMPETMQVYTALEILRRKGVRCGLVCDEFGEVQGLVTLSDVFKGLVGRIDAGDDLPCISDSADGSHTIVDAQCPVYDFLEHFGLEEDYEPMGYTTVAGLVLEALRRIPAVGDSVDCHGLHIEIAAMDGARIDSLRVSRLPAET